jgi:hypothetical protein
MSLSRRSLLSYTAAAAAVAVGGGLLSEAEAEPVVSEDWVVGDWFVGPWASPPSLLQVRHAAQLLGLDTAQWVVVVISTAAGFYAIPFASLRLGEVFRAVELFPDMIEAGYESTTWRCTRAPYMEVCSTLGHETPTVMVDPLGASERDPFGGTPLVLARRRTDAAGSTDAPQAA